MSATQRERIRRIVLAAADHLWSENQKHNEIASMHLILTNAPERFLLATRRAHRAELCRTLHSLAVHTLDEQPPWDAPE